MANTAWTTTEADQFLLDLWADQVEQTRERMLICTQLFNDAKQAYPNVNSVRGFQNLFIPTTSLLNSGSARTKTEGNDNTLTYDKTTDSSITLTIDQWVYQAIEVEDFADALSGYDIMELELNEVAEVIARDEDAFYAGFPDNFGTNIVGALGVPNTEDELLEAIQLLDDADVPQEGRKWGMSNRAYSRLFAQVKYTSMDFHGSRGVESGDIPVLYGYPVLRSTNVEGTNAAGHDNTLVHPSAVAYYRVGQAPRTRRVMAEDNISEKASISNIYGGTEVRDDHGVFLRGA